MASEDLSNRADDEAGPAPRPFDLATIRRLVRLMSRFELSEIDLTDGDRRIRLRRGLPARAAAAPDAPSAPAAAAPAAASPAEVPAPPARHLVEIKSPTPGTFYSRPKPDAEEFVRVGSRVNPETVVCLIEAMKMFNEIKAECSGVIAEVVAENGQFVEYGTVLFRVDPNG